MGIQIERLLPMLAMWGPWIFAGVAIACLAGMIRLGWGRPFLIPAHWSGRFAALALLAVAGVSTALLCALQGPMAPMLAQVRQVQGTVNHPAAEVSYRAVADDAVHHLQDLRGKVVILNLWATWCGPCRKEIPEIDKLQRAYADRGLVVVTLSTEDRPALQAFASSHPLATLNVYTPRFDWLNVDGRPLSLVIDRRGIVRECFIGARGYAEFERAVTRCLAQPASV